MKQWQAGRAALAVVVMGVLGVLGSCWFSGQAAASPGLPRMEQFAEKLRQHPADVAFGAVDVDRDNQTVEIRDVRFKDGAGGESLSIRSILFHDVDWETEPAPTHGRLRIRELKAPIAPGDDEMALSLRAAGYDSILIDGDFAFAYDEADGKLNVELRLDARELGLVSASLEAREIPGTLWASLFDESDEEARKAAVAQIALERFSFRYDGPSPRIASILPVSVQSVTVEAGKLAGNLIIPRQARMTMRGLTFNAARLQEPDAAEALRELGYDSLQANLDYQYTADEAAQKLDVRVNLDLADMGALRYEIEFGGVGPLFSTALSRPLWEQGIDRAPENLAAVGVAALAMTLNRADLHYEDRSLVSRAITAAARRQGISEEEARARMLNDIEANRAHFADRLGRQVIDAAIAFVRRPGVIGISLRPEPPVSYAELAALGLTGNYAELLRRLQLKIESR